MSPHSEHIRDGAQRALIYCRVSTKRQKDEGHGLDGQEHRCRQYAAAKGYAVDAVFPDDVSGGGDFMKRPGMVALLRYLDERPNERYVVIFDDLKRYARDTEFHLRLRRVMAERGATRECLNFNFEDTPEGKFFETIAAAQGELEREQNGRQVTQKMRARIEAGYYCFNPVLGYRYGRAEGGGKILVPDEPNATIVRDALEGFAAGRFQTMTEVKRFLEGFPTIRESRKGGVHLSLVIERLKRPLYAGLITVEKWGVRLQPGKHEPLISVATWRKIQDRMNGVSNAPARKDLRADFPLRGFVECGSCGHPMTAAWSRGRNRYYGCYLCQQRACTARKKSIAKDEVEGAFEALLRRLTPRPVLFDAARSILRDLWDSEHGKAVDKAERAKADIVAIDAKIAKLVSRIVETDDDRLIAAYESEIRSLDAEKLILAELSVQNAARRRPFDDIYRTACAFLANSWKLWASERLEPKRLVLRLAFSDRLRYCADEGCRTAKTALPFKVLGEFLTPKSGSVEVRE